MRTSRVNSVTSSIFRNERQYLQSNELFHRVMQDGSGQTPNQRQQQEQQSQSRGNEQKQNTPARRIRNKSKRKVEVELPLDTETMLEMQNRMLQHSTKINNSINKKVRMRTYRTSI